MRGCVSKSRIQKTQISDPIWAVDSGLDLAKIRKKLQDFLKIQCFFFISNHVEPIIFFGVCLCEYDSITII